MTEHRQSSSRLWIMSIAVFALSALVRIAPCHESYWVDELHTAWTVAESLADVAPRAAAGNQQPLYFWLLWFWQQVVGDSEVALRLTSVLAVSLSSGFMFVFVASFHRSILAGVASASIMAIETNALFFGTELRPYAGVMLASTIACGLTGALWNQSPSTSRHSTTWLGLIAAVGVAALIQATSLGVLVWLPFVLLFRWMQQSVRQTCRFYRLDISIFVIGVILAGSFWLSGALDTWDNRGLWASFALANSIGQIADLWDWLPLVVLPFVIFALGQLSPKGLTNEHESNSGTFVWMLLAVIAISTTVFWLIAYTEVAALWHRRYLIASFPMISWCFGGAIFEGMNRLTKRFNRTAANAAFIAASISLIAILLSCQGTLRRATRGEWLVSRGENWRGAIMEVNDTAPKRAGVLLHPGLIEQRTVEQNIKFSTKGDYLRYVVDGPYAIRDDLVVTIGGKRCMGQIAESPSDWILARGHSRLLAKSLGNSHIVQSYGGVTLAISRSVGRE